MNHATPEEISYIVDLVNDYSHANTVNTMDVVKLSDKEEQFLYRCCKTVEPYVGVYEPTDDEKRITASWVVWSFNLTGEVDMEGDVENNDTLPL